MTSFPHSHGSLAGPTSGRSAVRRLGLVVSTIAAVVLTAAAWLPATAAAAPTPRIDLKVLLLGTSTTEPDLQAWQSALQREGVRFDTIVGPSHTPITASTLSTTLSDGTPEAKYNAVIFAVGGLIDCSSGTCVSDLSSAEQSAINSYEHMFNIRQISGYIYPGSGYGMNTPSVSGALDGTAGALTAAGQTIFPYLKPTAPITMDTGTYGYEATPISTTNFDTLVTGPNGSSLVGIYYHPDGVQEMVESFDQNANQLQSELLRHGALMWVTRGVSFGDQRNYLETNIDDNFLADASWDTATHATDYNAATALRQVPSDVDNAASWSAQNNFRIDQLFNGGGSVQFAAGCTLSSAGDGGSGGTTSGCNGSAPGTDPLLAEFQKTNPATAKPYTASFGWVNHTWDHPNLDQGCSTQNYIQAEIQQNTNWGAKPAGAPGDPNGGGLGLTSTTDPTVALGAQNPGVVVTGEHSGLANLLPGNPGTVDPPSFDQATVSTTGGTLLPGTYTWAISDQFSPTGGESTASQTQQTLTAPGSVNLQWQAVCHASDYKIYRENMSTGVWTLVSTINAPTNAPPNSSFGDPVSTTDVTNGGSLGQTYTDTGSVGTPSSAPPTVNRAVESAYQQNTTLTGAFSAIGIQTFGSDSSKPYPNPATATFPAGSPPSSQYAAGATFPDGTARAEPRYPTNIYYNVSTEAQEVSEYNYLYLPPSLGGACVNTSTTTCLTAPATFADIVKSVDQGMFQHMMGNDPRPHYFHQTNLMGTPPPGPPTTGTPPNTSPSVGDGLYYSVMNQLMAQYGQYFNVPIQQPTSLAITNLLDQQAAWAGNTTVSGYIQGNQVTVTNSGGAVTLPLTGITTIGSPYGGTQSGWTSVPAGSSTYTAAVTWPVDGMAVTVSPGSMVANGTSTSTATATVTAEGHPVAGDKVAFTSSDSGEKIGTVTDNANGTYTATITSSTTPGTATITATDPSVAPAASGTATLTQSSGAASGVAVKLSPSSIVANGASTSTATATVTDGGGHPIAGDKVAFSSSDSGEKIGTVTDQGNGTYTATVTSSTTAGTPTITATDSSASPSASGQATLTQTAAPAGGVAVKLTPSSVVANGTSTSTATATVTDGGGHPIAGDKVAFSSSDSGEKIGTVTDRGNGTYTATITSSTTVHAVTITATDSSVSPSASGHATLTQTARAIAPTNVVAPSVSGTPAVARTLSAAPGTWLGTGPISYAYQWQRCRPGCAAIAGATSASYKLVAADQGARIRVSVTASNSAGSSRAFSAQVGPVRNAAAGSVKALLASLVVPSGKSASASALLNHGGYSVRFTTPAAGQLDITWSLSAHASKGNPAVVVAKARVHMTSTGKVKIKIALTRKGREILISRRHLKLAGKGTLTLPGFTRASVARVFSINR